mgnify:CR=1 FL=1
MSKKQYKNVYTILEKVKKGEIKTHYNEKQGGLFGKLNFYKKTDLVKPYVHYIDEDRLDSIVGSEVKRVEAIKEMWDRFTKSRSYDTLAQDKKPDLDKFHKKLQQNYEKIPRSMKYDIHKMYYHKIEKLEFEERTDKNHGRYKFLERANNPVGKIMSEGSNLKSAIFTKNMMLYYLMQLTMMEYTDPEAHKQMMQSLGGNGNPDQNDDFDDSMNKMMDNQLSKNMLDKMMKDAQDTCKMMDQNIDKEIQEKMFEDSDKSGGNQAGKLSPDYMRQITAQLQNMRINTTSLKDQIKHLLDRSTSFFSARKEVIYDDLLNTQDVSALDDFELLHPKLRKLFIEDIQVKDVKYLGKIDVYVDISGSMSSNCGAKNSEGKNVSKIDFAKSIIAKLKEMDMLNDVYLFDTRVKKYRNDLISISTIGCGGGTTINEAVRSIIRNDLNSLVITDAEDHCDVYSNKAFFIGVEGARFTSFTSEYMQAKQCVVFDGKRIFKVDSHGHTIH